MQDSYFSQTQSRRNSSSTTRWSEVIPPDTALTFAIVWDADDEDMIAFSGAQLLDTPEPRKSLDSPSSVMETDGLSQILTIRPPSSFIPYSENTASMAFFRENADFLFSSSTRTPIHAIDPSRNYACRTQTSSTLDGLDVYVRGSLLGRAHHNHRYYSCLGGLDADFEFDPRTSFAREFDAPRKQRGSEYIEDEGFFEMERPPPPPMSRKPSVPKGVYPQVCLQIVHPDRKRVTYHQQSPASSDFMSEFIQISSADCDSAWSAIERPKNPISLNRPSHPRSPSSQSQSQVTVHSPNRLKKRRPSDHNTHSTPDPAPAHVVLQRPDYSYNLASSTLLKSNSPSVTRSPSLGSRKFPRLFKWKRASLHDPWVCVEIIDPRTKPTDV